IIVLIDGSGILTWMLAIPFVVLISF
ncbi:hypothetical protein A2U01_0115407, partial [Trifolium medium]|nr:hypothetical protein [Trifolium medium]